MMQHILYIDPGSGSYLVQVIAAAASGIVFLNTYYFSDKDYSMLYDSISPVNSFRVVLNKYFQAGLPLLKDSTIRLQD